MQGFVYLDYLDRADEAMDALVSWHKAGKIRYQLNVIEGLRNAPMAFNKMFDGSNRGKLAVKMS
jgi:NADPH-dependent curcumin reductase CurA